MHSALRTPHSGYAAVGFLNKESNAKGHTMMAPSFENISTAAKLTLADLKAGGYKIYFDEDDGEWAGGVYEGQFQLKVLNNDGSTAALYNWMDYYEGDDPQEPETIMEPGWYLKEGKNYVKMTDAQTKAVVFNQGQGFWVLASGFKLVSAGGVNPKDVEFKTNAKGHTAIGNCSPVNLKLSDLTVGGYEIYFDEDDGEWAGGVYEGQFQLKVLNNDGSTAALYNWMDYYEGDDPQEPETIMEPGWYLKEGKNYVKMTKEQMDAVTIPAGQGFWTLGTGFKLVVPGPEL